MKHLKLFEVFGIDLGIAQQVEQYFEIITNNTNQKRFEFIFKNSLGEFNFILYIDPHYGDLGAFSGPKSISSQTPAKDLRIFLKNRNDKSTLLHEVKHLDFRIKNKNLYNTVYSKANAVLRNYLDAPDTLVEIFYVYDENEFQSKYHGYYVEFKKYCRGKVKSDTTIGELKNLFLNFLIAEKDVTWTWYMMQNEFKFEYFVTERNLDSCLYHMSQTDVVDKGDVVKYGKNWLTNNIKYFWSNVKRKLGFYTKEERVEIDKLKNYFETEFEKRHQKFKKKFVRIIPLVAQEFGLKY